MIKVDKIVTISLKHREDRRQLVMRELNKLKITTDFYLPEVDHDNRERGCFNSHLEVCKTALLQGHRHVLVFEDDVVIRPYHPKQIARINQFIDKYSNVFDIVYLGLIIGDMWFCGTQSIVRARGAGAHAYILSKRGMDKLASYTYNGTPIDKVMKREFKCYCIYPIIAEQYPETIVQSDISNTRKDAPLKDETFWRNNYTKQYYLPWKNLHKSIGSIFQYIIHK